MDRQNKAGKDNSCCGSNCNCSCLVGSIEYPYERFSPAGTHQDGSVGRGDARIEPSR